MGQEDILTVMQNDLDRAMKKAAKDRRWAMLIDLRKCVGCHACTVGCMSEYKTPPGLHYRPVYEYERGAFPKVTRTFLPRPCMQCDEPPCVDACPKPGKGGATWKETEGPGNGLVLIDYKECIGCGQCVEACPYHARTLDDGSFHSTGTPALQHYEIMPTFEYGKKWSRAKGGLPVEKARKCHFCLHRLTAGQLPACITTCIGRAGYFGDESDPESLIAKVKKVQAVQTLKPEEKTSPRVYYVANEKLEVLYDK